MADLAIGVDAGGTKIAAGVVDRVGQLGDTITLGTPQGEAGDPDVHTAVLETLAAAVTAMLDRSGAGRIAGVGLGLAGLMDRRTGVFLYGPNFPLRRVPVVAELEARLGPLGFVVESDAGAAAWAEHRVGAGEGCDELLAVTLGTGIGGGIVSGGRLWLGGHGHAGEFGHIPIDPVGPLCACGARGHWEAYASGTALDRLAAEAGGWTGAEVAAAAAAGDTLAVKVLDEFAFRVGQGLAALVQCFDPARVVIGGGVVEAGAALFDPLSRHLARELTGFPFRESVEVVPAGLGPWAGTVGAGLLVFDAIGSVAS
jgi:glucokinase